MSEIESDGVLRFMSLHDISVVGYTNWEPPQAEIRSYTYPDGSVKNSLTADELREFAAALEDMAEELAGR